MHFTDRTVGKAVEVKDYTNRLSFTGIMGPGDTLGNIWVAKPGLPRKTSEKNPSK